MTPDIDRLRAALGHEDLAWLIRRLHRRYASGRNSPTGTIAQRHPTPGQRDALDRLLGRRPSNGHVLSVRLDQLERLIVQSELAPSLRDAVEALAGPMTDERARRQRTQQTWAQVFEQLRPESADSRGLAAWYDTLRSSGLLRRLAQGDPQEGRRLLGQALRVAQRLPADGVTLAQLAAECCGDSHALDRSQPVGTLAVRAAAAMAGIEHQPTAAGRRRVWDAVGVICDELSAPVLVLNLPGADAGLTSHLLRQCAEVGEPCRITARQLLRHRPTFDPDRLGGAVHVCENPAVLAAAADALRERARTLVCIEGQPTHAARLLLTVLVDAGLTVRYHGDFDWGGIRIANHVIAHYGARPWRMATADYLAAPALGSRKLRGASVEATWDVDLARAMTHRGVAIHEELVLGPLLTDLAHPTSP